MRFAVHNTCSEDSALAYFDVLSGGFVEVANALNAAGGSYAPTLGVYLIPNDHELFDCPACDGEPVTCDEAKELTA